MLFFWILAIVLGVAVCLQGAANGQLAGRAGLPLTLSINSGLVFAGALAWYCIARFATGSVAERAPAPWTYYTGGVFGLLIISCAAVAYPRLGAGTTTALAVASQVVTALLLDRYGVAGVRLPLTTTRVLGLALIAIGVALVLGLGAKPSR
jgi:transporter family-2 protein